MLRDYRHELHYSKQLNVQESTVTVLITNTGLVICSLEFSISLSVRELMTLHSCHQRDASTQGKRVAMEINSLLSNK